ncbi:MAG: hypothetical protein AAGC72_01705, partial [Planctomycetota bacterium]
VGGATAVAGLVLGASIVLGPPAAQSNTPNLPSNIPAPGVNNPTDNPDNTPITIRAFDYSTFELDSDGQLRGMRLRATRTNLKPQGITELIKPHAEIRLGPQRAITITADKADMEMEDSKPRQGLFTGNVVVTIYEAPAGTTLILEDPSAEIKQGDDKPPVFAQFIQQRIYLDEATDFSIEDDTINTRGPVHVTSPQVDFFGIGLRLAYNTQRERIEQLIIDKGKYLIINPDAEAPSFKTANTNSGAGPPVDGDTSGTEKHQPVPKQFYAVTFEDNVLVRDGLESQLAGQTLMIDFSLGTDAVEVTPIAPDAVGQLPRLIPVGQLAQDDDIALLVGTINNLPAFAIPVKNLRRTLLNHDPARDIVVTWTGSMTVLPHAERPEPLADDDDALLTLTGPNAYAQTIRSGELERLETNKLEYLVSEERTTAHANDQRTLRILSEAMGGEITGSQLTVRQAQGTATILGPGELTYTDDETKKTLTLTWQNRLDLELYTEPKNANEEASGRDRSQTRILGVKTATFDGGVTARHTDFDLDSDKLTLAFAKPDKQRKIDNHPTEVNASGSVVIQARGDAKDETFDINAQRLTIELKLDGNSETYASAIHALDDVRIQRPGSQVACNRVSVELNPPDKSENNEEESEDRFAQVRMIFAVGKVRASLDYDDRRIDVVADQLIADVERDRLTLAANAGKAPAEIRDLTNGRQITGMLVEMDDQAEILNIKGAGTLATLIDDPNNEDADIEDAFLSIAWTKSMSFNNATGVAEFYESVRSESRRSTDASEMTCDTLVMVFSPEIKGKNEGGEIADDKNAERQVRSAIATGNVKFLASAWEIDNPDQIRNRVRLEGPKVVITNRPRDADNLANETLVVQGKGRMVLEDYRPPEDEDADKEASLTGRGATLFSWDDTMALDAITNTATLVGTVQMVHIPKDEQGRSGSTVQLDCQKLVADMTDTGGMSVWLSDDAPDAEIKSITATENVRLLQQGTRSMRGDTMVFDGEKSTVTLSANKDGNVIIEDLQRDNAARTNKAVWNLNNDRIEIDQLRGGVAPLN